jgi:hypothetical protein
MLHHANRLFLIVAAVAGAGAVLAMVAPWIGLGKDEAFIGFVRFGWTRSGVAIACATAACLSLVALAAGHVAACIRWLGSSAGREFVRRRNPFERWILETAFPALAATAATLLVFLIAAESYFRATIPFATSHWPSRFDPEIGFALDPGAEVRLTNGVDFWTTTRANSVGLLDREPPGAKKPGTCRILFVGDSFVEAAQVPVREKIQVVIEDLAKSTSPGLALEASAVGYSGTGQANQLPLFERFGRPLHPDLVVLVFVSNDFEDNSTVLRAISHGWHPEHPPRVFLARNRATGEGEFARVPIDPGWQAFAAPDFTGAASWAASFDRALLQASHFYGFLRGHWMARFPAAPDAATAQGRVRWLTAIPGYADALKGMDESDASGAVRFFGPDPLPPAMQDAVGATQAAISAFKAMADADGSRLLVLGTHSLRDPDGGTADSGQTKRLRAILEAIGIPYVDQMAHIRKAGGTAELAQFSRDGHWNAQGHRWAAEAVLARIAESPELCRAGR